jgi:hypothetical protein
MSVNERGGGLAFLKNKEKGRLKCARWYQGMREGE